MKKILALVLVLSMILALGVCAFADEAEAENVPATEKSEGVMYYADYMAADMDTEVVIEAYVQAKESWWSDKATVYAQDADGAYLLYDMAISAEDYDLLVPGQLIRVTGYKSEWSGQIEIVDATCEILEGNYIAEALDVTDILADTEALAEHMTALVAVKGLTVSAAPLYNWDGSGDRDSSDVYLTLALDGNDYSFTIRRYLTNNTTEVYQAAEALEEGQVIDIECFLYWYNGPQARIISIEVK